MPSTPRPASSDRPSPQSLLHQPVFNSHSSPARAWQPFASRHSLTPTILDPLTGLHRLIDASHDSLLSTSASHTVISTSTTNCIQSFTAHVPPTDPILHHHHHRHSGSPLCTPVALIYGPDHRSLQTETRPAQSPPRAVHTNRKRVAQVPEPVRGRGGPRRRARIGQRAQETDCHDQLPPEIPSKGPSGRHQRQDHQRRSCRYSGHRWKCGCPDYDNPTGLDCPHRGQPSATDHK